MALDSEPIRPRFYPRVSDESTCFVFGMNEGFWPFSGARAVRFSFLFVLLLIFMAIVQERLVSCSAYFWQSVLVELECAQSTGRDGAKKREHDIAN